MVLVMLSGFPSSVTQPGPNVVPFDMRDHSWFSGIAVTVVKKRGGESQMHGALPAVGWSS